MTREVALSQDEIRTDLLPEARTGSTEALGRLFEGCRGYLLIIAHQQLAGRLRAKIDAADIVQETFIEATRDFASFRGETAQQLLGWLRGILLNNLADYVRHYAAGCRCLSQEVRLGEQRPASSKRALLAEERSICEQVIAQEKRRAPNDALKRLPPVYRLVLQLHYHEQLCLRKSATVCSVRPKPAQNGVSRPQLPPPGNARLRRGLISAR